MGSLIAYPQACTAVNSRPVDNSTIVVLALAAAHQDENLIALSRMPGVTVLAVEPQEAPAHHR
jgi:hypothetical protein